MHPARGKCSGEQLRAFTESEALRAFRRAPTVERRSTGRGGAQGGNGERLLPEALHESYERGKRCTARASASGIRVARGATRELRIHGDCHLGNLLWNEHGPVFVDLDDCVMGPGIQDLWMMLSGSPAEQQRQWQELLEGYQQFADFDFRELLLIEPLAGCV